MDGLDNNIKDLLKLKYGIIGDSPPMQNVIKKLVQVAPTDLTVLITGETGTGKEIFANAIHGLSNRKKNALLSVNCGAIPETLLESELFGHEKGAFTGASDQRKGFFEVADRGTIFLDEIGEMPVGTQVKLLRILESGEFIRLGSSEIRRVNVRMIAATNRNLEIEVQKGNFRQDLFFRLNSVQVQLPPLRLHLEDIPVLVNYFAEKVCSKLGLHFDGVSSDAVSMLKTLPWHGNVRELRNLVETLVTLEQSTFITPELVRRYLTPALPPAEISRIPENKSIAPFNYEEEHRRLELELIFRTLIELKHDLKDIMKAISELSQDLDAIKMDVLDLHPEIKHQVINDDSFTVSDVELKINSIEKETIKLALKKSVGNRREAAKALGISERTLYRKINQYEL